MAEVTSARFTSTEVKSLTFAAESRENASKMLTWIVAKDVFRSIEEFSPMFPVGAFCTATSCHLVTLCSACQIKEIHFSDKAEKYFWGGGRLRKMHEDIGISKL